MNRAEKMKVQTDLINVVNHEILEVSFSSIEKKCLLEYILIDEKLYQIFVSKYCYE